MGVRAKGRRLYFRLKGPDGLWVNQRSDYWVGQEEEAEQAFEVLVRAIAAGEEMFGERTGPPTVAEYAEAKWFPPRRQLIADWKSDETRLRKHVLPAVGKMALRDVRPRHLVELFAGIRAKGSLAPKSIYNVYGVVKALFRDAKIAELVSTSPCILDEQHLGPNVDADPEWRPTALYEREELEQLIADPRIPFDRQVMYGLQGLAGVRHGEAAGLRFRHYVDAPVLGKLVIATSYDLGRTKTKRPRYVPVHPVLAAMLGEWKLSGWPAMMGRAPVPDDLVVPMSAPMKGRGPRVPLGRMRTDHNSYKRLMADLAELGLRHRRGHDLRRTFITLARVDGASKDVLQLVTHNPTKKSIDVYTSFPWEALCSEVAKLKVQRRVTRRAVAMLPGAAGSPEGGLVTPSLPSTRNPAESRMNTAWRRRESNPPLTTSGDGRPAQLKAASSGSPATSAGAAPSAKAGRESREQASGNEVTADLPTRLATLRTIYSGGR